MTKKILIDEAVVKQVLKKIAKAKELCDKQSKLDRRVVYGNVLIEHFDTICQALEVNNEVVNGLTEQSDYNICPACGGIASDPIVPVEARQQAAEQDLAELIDALKKFRGLPPHNSMSNPCQGDGYFYAGIEAKYTPEQIAAANVSLDTSTKPAQQGCMRCNTPMKQATEPVVGWVLLREDADGFEPIMFYGGKEKPEGEFKDRFTLRPIRFADATQQDGTNGVVALQERLRQKPGDFQPLTAAQVLALYQKWGTGRLDGFTEAIREYEAALGIEGE